MSGGGGPAIEGQLRALLSQLALGSDKLETAARSRRANSIRSVLGEIQAAAGNAIARMDPIAVPERIFDPTSPDVAAWTVVLALLAQPRVKLAEVAPEYGPGIYALYYLGDHPLYRPVSMTETPIYVGKADPDKGFGASLQSQGATLTGRLADHRRQVAMIERHALDRAEELAGQGLHDLRVEDFECRKLVCAAGTQLTAESRLIGLFRPIWNSDFDVAHGISKHGDRQRKHPKSPWDVLHPGRPWADGLREDGSPFPDQLTVADVRLRIEAHLPSMTVFNAREDVIRAVLDAFAQRPATADPGTAELLEQQAEAELNG